MSSSAYLERWRSSKGSFPRLPCLPACAIRSESGLGGEVRLHSSSETAFGQKAFYSQLTPIRVTLAGGSGECLHDTPPWLTRSLKLQSLSAWASVLPQLFPDYPRLRSRSTWGTWPVFPRPLGGSDTPSPGSRRLGKSEYHPEFFGSFSSL